MPDIVIEVASHTDEWKDTRAKIDVYRADGAGYAVALDPTTRTAYERGTKPRGLALDYDAIFDA